MLKFTTLTECENALTEINKRMRLNSNVTSTFATPRVDINGAYIIPNPKASVMNKIEFLVRDVEIESQDEEGNPITVNTIDKVNKTFDEITGEDTTVYDGTEYLLTQQTNLSDEFTYEEVETVEWPIVESEEV